MENTIMDTNRARLLRKIQEKCFFSLDLGLYLNTHPFDKRALKMHMDTSRNCKMLIQEFEKQYGPLTMGSSDNPDYWDWIKGPWPWDNQ